MNLKQKQMETIRLIKTMCTFNIKIIKKTHTQWIYRMYDNLKEKEWKIS